MIVQLENIHLNYMMGKHRVSALNGINLQVLEKDFLVLSGASGSGKSSLLNIIGCLNKPTSGKVLFNSLITEKMNENQLAKLRSQKIGFIFQTFNLLPVLTALENVEYALINHEYSAAQRFNASQTALERVGLKDFASHRPDQLSGGQRQRVAIARALVKKPQLILADEPTANLDIETSTQILSLMNELNTKDGLTFVIASHDPTVVALASKAFHISDGKIKT